MKTNKKIKNLFCYMVVFVLAIIANFSFMSIKKTDENVFATSNDTSPITIPNGNFDEDEEDVKNFDISNKDSNVTTKVINTEDTEYTSRFKNLDRGSLYDNNVLMIDGSEKPTDLGYTTSKEIELAKDGTYMISVDVYTAEGGVVDLYLYEGEEEFSSFKTIVSENNWTTHYFFIKNDNVDGVKVKLGLFLKSQGVALFDNIIAHQINENEYSRLTTEKLSETEYKVVNNRKNIITDYTTISLKNTLSEANVNLTEMDNSFTDSDGYHSSAVKITNRDLTYSTYTSTNFSNDDNSSEYISLEQNGIYKVTVMAKAENLTGNATITLSQIVEDEETTNDTTITISKNTTSENSITNNYNKYSFYVTGNPEKTTNFKLVLGLGSEGEKASGSLYVSSVEISRITSTAYTSGSSDTNGKQIDLSKDYQISSANNALDNAMFDIITVSDQNKQYPYNPTSWDVSLGENTQYYGVINTSETEFAKLSNLGLINLVNPKDTRNGGTYVNNNVLMLHNEQADTLSYTSTSKNLTASSIHKFETSIQTQNSPATLSLVTTIDNKEIVLSSITVKTNGSWEQVQMYIKTGYQALDVSLKITLDSDSWAYTYVDNARFDYYSQPTEDDFNAITNSTLISKVDLTNLFQTTESTNYSTPSFFTATGDSVEFGIVDVNNGPYTDETFKSINAEKVIGVRAMNDSYTKITSSLGYKLSSGKYYKISVSVYTQFLQMLDKNADTTLIGAGIKLSRFDETFTQIVSDKAWTTYNFYVNPDSDTTTYIELYFGNENAKMTGDVFFGNIEFTSDLAEDKFNQATESSYSKILKATTVQDETETDDDTTETPEENNSNINWLYYASSLLFALAIVIAIVGIMVRKIKWKKPQKKTKNAYDRNRTVSKQVYMRKATTLREEKLHELNKDLEKLHSERVKYEEEYKHGLAKLRDMKIKRANPTDIKKLEKEMHKNQKLSASIGVTINHVEAEIKFVNSEAYLNATMKKLASQPVDNSQSEQ